MQSFDDYKIIFGFMLIFGVVCFCKYNTLCSQSRAIPITVQVAQPVQTQLLPQTPPLPQT